MHNSVSRRQRRRKRIPKLVDTIVTSMQRLIRVSFIVCPPKHSSSPFTAPPHQRARPITGHEVPYYLLLKIPACKWTHTFKLAFFKGQLHTYTNLPHLDGIRSRSILTVPEGNELNQWFSKSQPRPAVSTSAGSLLRFQFRESSPDLQK